MKTVIKLTLASIPVLIALFDNSADFRADQVNLNLTYNLDSTVISDSTQCSDDGNLPGCSRQV